MFLQSTLWAFGGRVFSEDGKTVNLDSPATQRAVKYVVGLFQDKLIPAGAFAWDGASNNKNFLAECSYAFIQ